MSNSKYITAFIPLILISFDIKSQERSLLDFDEDFLAGLPESSREQLEVNENSQEDEKLKQLFNADASIKNTKQILKNLRDQIDNIEKTIDPEGVEGGDSKLEVFGSYFFQNIQSTFMPVNVANVSDDYYLDVGDELDILLTGRSNKTMSQVINRDGSILIQGIGKVNLAGKTFAEAQALTSAYVESVSIGSKAYVSLSKLRDIQVLITGAIKAPGIYTVSGGSNILGAINNAGGMKKNGSFRRVDLLRKGKLIHSFDLYDLIAFGKYDAEHTLKSGDTIFVHPVTFHVSISGGINTPGIFEIRKGETIKDAINFAGGFNQGHFGYDYLKLERMSLGSFETIKVDLKNLNKVKLMPRDILKIPHFYPHNSSLKQVAIEGEVQKPGTYFIEEGESLSQLISRAGGYKPNAYIYGSALFRKTTAMQEKFFAQRNYSDTVAYIISNIGKPNTSVGSDALQFLAEEVKAKDFAGRVVVNFNINKIKNNPAEDLLLESDDRIVIPNMNKVLYMFGDFMNPMTVTYDASMSVNDYISMSGGLKDSANTKLLIIDPDGKTSIFNANRWAFSSKVDLYPGSIIYATRDIGELNGIVYASTVAPILSSVALSLASLNAIND